MFRREFEARYRNSLLGVFWLVLGPDRSGNLLEVVVLVSADGSEMIIHAMAMRPIYRRLLER